MALARAQDVGLPIRLVAWPWLVPKMQGAGYRAQGFYPRGERLRFGT